MSRASARSCAPAGRRRASLHLRVRPEAWQLTGACSSLERLLLSCTFWAIGRYFEEEFDMATWQFVFVAIFTYDLEYIMLEHCAI